MTTTMQTLPAPRTGSERKRDALTLLRTTTTAWVSTAGPGGPHMVPLLYVWDGERLTMATAEASPTVRNLHGQPKARAAVGTPYDVVMIDATVEFVHPTDIDQPTGDQFASLLRGGPDPRFVPGFVYLRLTPQRIQAWNGFHELTGRTLMRDGTWRI
jgi:general stress protein 26